MEAKYLAQLRDAEIEYARHPSADALIHVELRRGPLHLSVRWPRSAAGDCTAWLRELTIGLLK